MNRVVHFEFGVVKPERAAKFYTDVFGWAIEKWDSPQPYWLISTGDEKEPGINGGMMVHADMQPRTVNTIAVSNLEEMMKKVEANGGHMVVAKTAIPGVGWLAYFKDTEGNVVGLHQFDSTAK